VVQVCVRGAAQPRNIDSLVDPRTEPNETEAAALEALAIDDFREWVQNETTKLENYQTEGEAATAAALKSGPEVVSEVPKP
jgi:hypothetical protein